MDSTMILLQGVVVIVAILLGVRTGGIGLGLWGLVGLAVLAALGLTTLAVPHIEGSLAGVALNLLAGLAAGTLFALCEEIGYLRVASGSIWPVASAHSAVNVAWGISMEVSQTKSPLVLEYIGGESGVLMICGLLAADAVLIRKLRNAERDAQA